jgi:hypothetical protein
VVGKVVPEQGEDHSLEKDDDGLNTILTESELARRHQRSVKTIRNLRVRGGYVPFLKIGRHVRYRLADVLAYEEQCLRQSTSDTRGADDNE